MLKPIEITRKNRQFYLEQTGDKEIKIFLAELSNRISVTGEQEVNFSVIFYEDDPIRIGDLIDALTEPDVLHPITKDIKLSPFGKTAKQWVKIQWDGWNFGELSKKIPYFSGTEYPDLPELVGVLNALHKHSGELVKKGTKLLRFSGQKPKDIEEFYRKTATMLVDIFSQLMPVNPWVLRGFLPLPFRVLTIGRFLDNKFIQIRLSPFEARRIARFLKFIVGS